MGKRLTISYGDQVLYDEEPFKVAWVEARTGVFEVHAETNAPPPKPSQAEQAAQLMQQLQKQGAGGVAGKSDDAA